VKRERKKDERIEAAKLGSEEEAKYI